MITIIFYTQGGEGPVSKDAHGGRHDAPGPGGEPARDVRPADRPGRHALRARLQGDKLI